MDLHHSWGGGPFVVEKYVLFSKESKKKSINLGTLPVFNFCHQTPCKNIFVFFLILLSCFPAYDLKGGTSLSFDEILPERRPNGGKNMNTKWGHIVSRFAFEFNCRIGKTHILCGWGRLYIYTVSVSVSLCLSLALSLCLSLSLSLSPSPSPSLSLSRLAAS